MHDPAEPRAASGGRSRADVRIDLHRLYVPARVIGSALATMLVALLRWDGHELPVATGSLVAAFAAWPVVMYALRVPFPSNRAADRLQLLDGVAMGAVLAVTQAQSFLLLVVGNVFSAIAIGGLRAAVVASLLAGASCSAVLLATGGTVHLHRDLARADVAAIAGFALYAAFTAMLGFRSREKLLTARRALDTLSRSLEARVEERTRALASTNAAISRFVPQEFLNALGHDDVTSARLGQATAREVTVLFADIRDFTTLSERMSPEETFRFLNDCLSRLGPHVRAQSGFVDKYIGDAIMALFPHAPGDAVRAAVAMQRELLAGAEHGVAIGVGIHAGRVMMGTIGEEQRFEATVISDAVNLTARLESLTKQLGCSVLVSGEVFAHLTEEERRDTRPLGTFTVKGKLEAVALVEVFAGEAEARRASKRLHAPALAEAIALHAEGQVAEALARLAPYAEAAHDDGPLHWWRDRLVRALDGDLPESHRGVIALEHK